MVDYHLVWVGMIISWSNRIVNQTGDLFLWARKACLFLVAVSMFIVYGYG